MFVLLRRKTYISLKRKVKKLLLRGTTLFTNIYYLNKNVISASLSIYYYPDIPNIQDNSLYDCCPFSMFLQPRPCAVNIDTTYYERWNIP